MIKKNDMKKIILNIFILLIISTLGAQSKKKKDISSIKNMCGCFEITFDFAETFIKTENKDYNPSKKYRSGGLEWAQLVKDDKNQISIQHILVSGSEEKPYIIKHWRQDWLFQNTDFYMYDHDNLWKYVKKNKKEVKGQWTQKVFQVDDSPRYEGSGTWVHVDGKSYWENTTSAPLPRREYSKRNDYNVMQRGNRQETSIGGWIHDQNNSKIVRENGKRDVILADEKGYNNYVKVDDSKCKAAIDWWNINKNKWENVRNKWKEVYDRKKDLSLKKSLNNKPLYMVLFSDQVNEKNQINPLIESYINY
jgi:hypothetical protein